MVYCIQAQLAFQNAARRNTVSTNIQTYIASKTTWGPVYRADYTNQAAQPAVALEVRFTTQAQQDQAWLDILGFVGTGINGPVVGSGMTRHPCTHDQALPAPCVVAQTQSW